MQNAHRLDGRHVGLLFLLALTAASCDFDFNLGNLFGGENPPDYPYRPPGVGHIYVLAPADSFEIRLPARWNVSADSCNSTYFCDSILQASIRTDSYVIVDRVDMFVRSGSMYASVRLGTVYHPESSTFNMPYFTPDLYDIRFCPFTCDTAHYSFYLILYSRATQYYSYTTHVRLIFHDSTRTDSLPDAPRMDAVLQRPLDSALIVSWCDRSFNENCFLIYHMIADLPATDPDTITSAEWDYYFWHPLRNKRYSFFAAARNAYGMSPCSDTISIMTW